MEEATLITSFKAQDQIDMRYTSAHLEPYCPVPDESPTKILEREVFMFSGSYSRTAVPRFSINPLEYILNSPVIKRVISDFRFLAFDAIEVRIENAQHKALTGVGYVGHLPWRANSNITDTTFRQYINYESQMIDVADPAAIVMTIPLIMAAKALDLSTYVRSAIIKCCTMWIYFPDPSVSDFMEPGATGRLSYYARLINPRVSLIQIAASSPAVAVQLVDHQSLTGRMQMVEKYVKVAAGTGALASGIVGYMAHGMRSSLSNADFQMLSHVQPSENAVGNSGAPVPNRPDAFGPFSPVVNNDVTFAGLDVGYMISSAHFAEQSNKHMISDLIQRPGFMYSDTINVGTTRWIYTQPFSSRGTMFDPLMSKDNSWMNFLSNYFRFYKGSIVYHLVVCGNCFQNRRLSIYLSTKQISTISDIAPNTGEAYASHHNITGTQVLRVCVPYYAPDVVQNTWGMSTPSVFLNVAINYVSGKALGQTTDLAMTFHVFKSAGPDFKFYETRAPLEARLAALAVDHQCNFLGPVVDVYDFPSQAGSSVPHRTVDTLEDLMAIPSFRQVSLASEEPVPLITTLRQDFATHSNYDTIGNTFMYVRGSVRFKYPLNPDPALTTSNFAALSVNSEAYTDVIPSQTIVTSAQNSMVATNPFVQPVLAAEIPIIYQNLAWSPLDFSGVFGGPIPYQKIVMNSGAAPVAIVSAGKYFQGFLPLFPPTYTIFPNQGAV